MKRIFTFLLAITCFAYTSQAQLPDGSIAPDFTVTDLDGNTHNLYDYLDDGKYVILDIMASWCSPCWAMHEAEVLKDFHALYGPEGTNEVVIISVEGDPRTSVGCLSGPETCDFNGAADPLASLGDWLTGVEYIFVNDDNLATTYDISGFPNIYSICPNRQTTLSQNFGGTTVADLEAMIGACVPASNGTDGALLSIEASAPAACGDLTVAPKVLFQNNGTEEVTALSIDLMVNDNTVETIDWTGSLMTYHVEEFSFASITEAGGSTIEAIVTSVNGSEDVVANNNMLTTSLGSNTAQTTETVTFEIRTDFWPEEVSWELLDENDEVVASSTDLGTLSCDEVYTQEYDLVVGSCYKFSILDSFGDGLLNGPINPTSHSCDTENGMNSEAMGAVSLSSSLGVIFEDIDYGTGTDIIFNVEMSSSNNNIEDAVEELSLFPNPVKDVLNVSFNLETSTTVKTSIISTVGQVMNTSVANFSTGQNQTVINTANLSNGMYIVTFETAEGITSKKFTVSK